MKQVIASLFMGYLVTLTGIFLVAILLLLLPISEDIVDISVLLIYVVSCVICGYCIGKERKHKFMWGMLGGCLYEVLLLVLSVILNASLEKGGEEVICLVSLCMASGGLGGIVFRKKRSL
ncbi:MAG: TIGR04086 family membrane protein [Lachnospiraceae bacterium]|nr:TIGR04086 family membrane protein [Lachnospiraceae bacterium]